MSGSQRVDTNNIKTWHCYCKDRTVL